MNSILINSLLLGTFIAYCCIPEANAISCFVCTSIGNKSCINNPTETVIVPCPAATKSCFKMYGKYMNEEIMTRGCTAMYTQCELLGSADTGFTRYPLTCDYCTSDMCNSAIISGGIKSKQIVGAIFAFMVVILFSRCN